MRRGLLAAALILSAACSASVVAPSPSASVETTASIAPSASPSVIVSTAVPSPRTTPPGTPAPHPALPTSGPDTIATPPPDPRPTATAEPGLWRIEGYVVDESGEPLPGVCVVVGPNGCRTFSPHTDDRGHWWIDIAVGQATFDFFFEQPGHKTVWWHTTPNGPTEFDVILPNG